jgi:hypothetical protein
VGLRQAIVPEALFDRVQETGRRRDRTLKRQALRSLPPARSRALTTLPRKDARSRRRQRVTPYCFDHPDLAIGALDR